MTQGWIKLHRGFTKFEWYQDANTMRVFLHLLITANHKKAKWQGNTIGRGQLITSHANLAKDLGLTIQKVRTSLSKLENSENVTVKSTSKFTLLSVCNYDTYQSENSATNTPFNQPPTTQQPEQRAPTNPKRATSQAKTPSSPVYHDMSSGDREEEEEQDMEEAMRASQESEQARKNKTAKLIEKNLGPHIDGEQMKIILID